MDAITPGLTNNASASTGNGVAIAEATSRSLERRRPPSTMAPTSFNCKAALPRFLNPVTSPARD